MEVVEKQHKPQRGGRPQGGQRGDRGRGGKRGASGGRGRGGKSSPRDRPQAKEGPSEEGYSPAVPKTPVPDIGSGSEAEKLPAAPAAEPKPKKAEEKPTVASNAASYGLALPRTSKHLIDKFEGEGYAVHRVAKVAEGHPISHAMRAYATARALAYLHSKGVRHVVSVYGADRDFAIVDHLNKGVSDSEKLHLYVTGVDVVPHDVNRRSDPRCLDGPHSAKLLIPSEEGKENGELQSPIGIMLVDVYHDPLLSVQSSTPLTPGAVADLMAMFRSRETTAEPVSKGWEDREVLVTWVGHMFDGAFGSIENEGAWRRVGGLIESRPDPHTACYPPHPPCDWLFTSGGASFDHKLAWIEIFRCSSMRCLSFRRSTLAPIASANAPVSVGFKFHLIPDLTRTHMGLPIDRYIFDSLPDFVVRHLWVHIFRPRVVVIDEHVLRECRQWLAGRAVSVYTDRQLCLKVRDELPRKEWFRCCLRNFPEALADTVDDTVRYAVLVDIENREADLAAVERIYSGTFSSFNKSLTGMGTEPKGPPASGIAGRLLMATGLVTVMYVAWKLKQSSPWWFLPKAQGSFSESVTSALSAAQSNAVSLITTVVVEEAIRSLMLMFLPAWMVVTYNVIDDTVADYMLGLRPWMNPAVFAVRTLTRVALHSTFTGLQSFGSPGTLAAVSAHVAWNSAMSAQPQAVKTVAAGFFGGLLWKGLTLIPRVLNWFPATRPLVAFGQWLYHYHKAPWADRGTVVEGPGPLMPMGLDGISNTYLKESHPPSYDEWNQPTDLDKPHRAQLPFVDNLRDAGEISQERVHLILAVSAPGYVPGRTDAMLKAALHMRVLRPVLLEPEEQARAWESVPRPADLLFSSLNHRANPYGPIIWEEHTQEWLDHIEDGTKHARAASALAQVKNTPVTANDRIFNKTQVMLKTNEMLFKRVDRPVDVAALSRLKEAMSPEQWKHFEANVSNVKEKLVSLKPRLITNVHPMAQAVIGPVVFEATRRLKEAWPMHWADKPPITFVHGTPVYISYGAAAKVSDLCYYVRSLTWGWWILCAGDDSAVFYKCKNGTLWIFESDAEVFDDSQSTGPLTWENDLLEALGADEYITSLLERLAASRRVLKGKHGVAVVDCSEWPRRPTGGPETSFGNTSVMAAAWFQVISNLPPRLSKDGAISLITAEFATLGFRIKLKIHENVSDATFLKGWWMEGSNGYIWAPLPSRILKAGKSLIDPRQIFPNKDLPVPDRYPMAAKQFLTLQAKSYAAFPQVPVLRAFVRRFQDGPSAPPDPHFHEVEPWKVQADELVPYLGEPDEAALIEQFCRRYDCSPDEVAALEALILQSEAGTMVVHPLFERMACVDYS